MPRIIHEGTGIYSATLLLQWKKENIWIWTGKNQIQTNTNEEPLTLKFNGKEFYFYSTGLEKNNDNKPWYLPWQNHKLNLNYSDKEKMIKKLDDFIDQNDLNWKHILLKHKVSLLEDLTKELSNQFCTISSNSNTYSNLKIKNIEEEIEYLNKCIKDSKSKIKNFYFRIYMLWKRTNKELTCNQINKDLKNFDTEIDILVNNSSNLIKKNDSLINDLTNNPQNSMTKSNPLHQGKIELNNDSQPSTKKLKISQEEIDFNFEIAQEIINGEKEKETNKLKKLEEAYIDNFDLEIL